MRVGFDMSLMLLAVAHTSSRDVCQYGPFLVSPVRTPRLQETFGWAGPFSH